MNRDNNGDDAIVIIQDPPGENYKWIRNQSSSELQKFRFFSLFWLRKAGSKHEILRITDNIEISYNIIYNAVHI